MLFMFNGDLKKAKSNPGLRNPLRICVTRWGLPEPYNE